MRYLLIVLLLATPAYAGWAGPGNYGECLDEYVPRSETNRAAEAIVATCRMQFKKNHSEEDYLTLYSCVRGGVAAAKNETAAKIMLMRCQERSGVK